MNNDLGLLNRLNKPAGPVDVVLDTDAATEVDDPFAISYLLLSPERFRVKAVYAAPFSMNERAQDPKTGMEMSYREILNIQKLCHKEGGCEVKKGSASYLSDKKRPVPSAAASDLAERAMKYSPENPLYVIGIGAGTNIASALLQQPEIISRIVVVWLAGNDFNLSPDVYNIYQDVKAAQEAVEQQEFTASVGGGAVSATANGKKELTAVAIKPETVDPEDVEMLQDLVVSAGNEALRQADDAMTKTMDGIGGGLNLGAFGL